MRMDAKDLEILRYLGNYPTQGLLVIDVSNGCMLDAFETRRRLSSLEKAGFVERRLVNSRWLRTQKEPPRLAEVERVSDPLEDAEEPQS
jgi:predicted DNA-binding transcriptional regulator